MISKKRQRWEMKKILFNFTKYFREHDERENLVVVKNEAAIAGIDQTIALQLYDDYKSQNYKWTLAQWGHPVHGKFDATNYEYRSKIHKYYDKSPLTVQENNDEREN